MRQEFLPPKAWSGRIKKRMPSGSVCCSGYDESVLRSGNSTSWRFITKGIPVFFQEYPPCELTYPHQGTFEDDDYPLPKVGYLVPWRVGYLGRWIIHDWFQRYHACSWWFWFLPGFVAKDLGQILNVNSLHMIFPPKIALKVAFGSWRGNQIRKYVQKLCTNRLLHHVIASFLFLRGLIIFCGLLH